ncbi:protein jagged-1-like [Ptychodera flava]|uniref:protein jagged-1-like n=1 Tax=Ptychodera flava TaxID=63121 RepID=UPI003969C310
MEQAMGRVVRLLLLQVILQHSITATEGCKNGWEARAGSEDCYFFSIQTRTWQNSRSACQNEADYSELASIHSSGEDDWISSRIGVFTWIGLNDIDVEGQFVWSDGTDVVFTNWAPGEPDDGGFIGGEDCVEKLATWFDSRCGQTRRYVCKRDKEARCRPNPCLNEGICKDCWDDTCTGHHACFCKEDYHGDNCESRKTCLSHPVVCENNGTCADCSDPETCSFYYECVCTDDYHGEFCQHRKTCQSHPPVCENDGACANCPNPETCSSYYDCLCTDDYYGDHCENRKSCQSHPPICENDGTCSDCSDPENCDSYYDCVCTDNYYGLHCENRKTCESHPPGCQNEAPCTNCIDEGSCENYYQCDCTDDFYGTHCENRKTCLSHPVVCENDGTCTDCPDPETCSVYYDCVCTDDYYGDHCENRKSCQSHPPNCENDGTCSDCSDPDNCDAYYSCICTDNYYGLNCENRKTCASHPPGCQNDASCTNCADEGSCDAYYECDCTDDYYGTHCENRKTCVSHPPACQNDATCLNCDDPGACEMYYSCQCTDNYHGNHCENWKTCDSHPPCENNGVCQDCVDEVSCPNYFECFCEHSFYGQRCENPCTHIDHCTVVACTTADDHYCQGDCDYSYTCTDPDDWRVCERAYDLVDQDGYPDRYCRPRCSWRDDSTLCYPGSCPNARETCECTPGYANETGHCLKILSEVTWSACVVKLILSTGEGDTTVASVGCITDSTRFVPPRTEFNAIDVSWATDFQEPSRVGYPRPHYLYSFDIGVVGGSFEWEILEDDLTQLESGTVECVNGYDEDNPHKDITYCQEQAEVSQPTNLTLYERVKVTVISSNGGNIKIMDKDDFPTNMPVYTHYYHGETSLRLAEFAVDGVQPFHCSERSDCQDNMVDVQFDGRDSLVISWSGWTDDMSGVQRYEWCMNPVEDTHSDGCCMDEMNGFGGPSVSEFAVKSPEMGLFCVKLVVYDGVGNHASVTRFVDFDGKVANVLQTNPWSSE